MELFNKLQTIGSVLLLDVRSALEGSSKLAGRTTIRGAIIIPLPPIWPGTLDEGVMPRLVQAGYATDEDQTLIDLLERRCLPDHAERLRGRKLRTSSSSVVHRTGLSTWMWNVTGCTRSPNT